MCQRLLKAHLDTPIDSAKITDRNPKELKPIYQVKANVRCVGVFKLLSVHNEYIVLYYPIMLQPNYHKITQTRQFFDKGYSTLIIYLGGRNTPFSVALLIGVQMVFLYCSRF